MSVRTVAAAQKITPLTMQKSARYPVPVFYLGLNQCIPNCIIFCTPYSIFQCWVSAFLWYSNHLKFLKVDPDLVWIPALQRSMLTELLKCALECLIRSFRLQASRMFFMITQTPSFKDVLYDHSDPKLQRYSLWSFRLQASRMYFMIIQPSSFKDLLYDHSASKLQGCTLCDHSNSKLQGCILWSFRLQTSRSSSILNRGSPVFKYNQ